MWIKGILFEAFGEMQLRPTGSAPEREKLTGMNLILSLFPLGPKGTCANPRLPRLLGAEESAGATPALGGKAVDPRTLRSVREPKGRLWEARGVLPSGQARSPKSRPSWKPQTPCLRGLGASRFILQFKKLASRAVLAGTTDFRGVSLSCSTCRVSVV